VIPKSRGVVAIAVAIAVATHSLALIDYSPGETAEVEGGRVATAAALGSTFKDFVAGTNAPAPARTRQKSAVPHQFQPQASPTVQQRAATPPTLNPIPAGTTAAFTRTAVQTPRKPAETETAKTQVDVASSPPIMDAQRPRPEKQTTNQTATPKGNAKQSERKGDATGKTPEGAAKAKTSKQAVTGSGNAEASNYAGRIKRKIFGARRKSTNIRGAALVAFRIADNGTLQTVSIVRSSGSKRLDQIALAQVKAAAPFPPPPAAVRRDYSFEIMGQR